MYIYKITNTITQKIYIGKQVRENKHYMGSGKLIKLSILKYGIENFKKEIIEVCSSKKELSNREIFWISYYKSQDRNVGYNITKGGDGNNTNKHFLGKKLSESHRKKISDNHHDVSGIKNPMFGKTHTDDVKLKLSELKKGTSHSKETKKKFSNLRKGSKNSNSKLNEETVTQIRNDYNKMSIKEITLKYNLKKSCVWKIVNYVTWSHV